MKDIANVEERLRALDFGSFLISDRKYVRGGAMPHPIYEMIDKVTDEKSFNAFLTALRKDCEWHERNGGRHDRMECVERQHFEAHSTRDFLKSMEDWATGGDFAEGRHYGEPILRRIAAMMWVGRFRWPGEEDDESGGERE